MVDHLHDWHPFLRSDLSLPASIVPDVFFLDHNILCLVLEDDIQAARVQIIELLQRGRHETVPLSIELFDLQLVTELLQRRVGLAAHQLALDVQIGDVLAHISLLLDHFLADAALTEVLAFDELSDHVLVLLVADQAHHLGVAAPGQLRVRAERRVALP